MDGSGLEEAESAETGGARWQRGKNRVRRDATGKTRGMGQRKKGKRKRESEMDGEDRGMRGRREKGRYLTGPREERRRRRDPRKLDNFDVTSAN